MRSSRTLDRLLVTFDDEHAVANAGLVLPATLTALLGLEATANEVLDLGDGPGAARPGRKVLTLVHGMLAGGDCIDDVDMLRAGATETVLAHRVMAPSTCGTFCARSRSVMSVSSTAGPKLRSVRRGRRGPVPQTGR